MSAKAHYTLYAATIFLSAFLLFAVQPIAGKHLLPYFGGSSAVWATSMLFFTCMLFFGYLYVYLLTTYAGKRQVHIHVLVVALAAVAGLAALLVWRSMFPPLAWVAGNPVDPSLNLLLVLLIAIGAPFFLLSTTGPLFQYWYGVTSGKEPYKLYALSNAGSFLALIAYPFLIEPLLRLSATEFLWLMLFFAYVAVCGIICYTLWRSRVQLALRSDRSESAVSIWRRTEWLALAALPAFLLIATTTEITQVVAPMPLLWVVPLALYLLTFILAFAGRGQSIYVPLLLLVCAFFAYSYTPAEHSEIVPRFFSYLVLLFFTGLACHARLYAMRPSTEGLPAYYVLISLGGMLGTLLGSLLAPLLFPDFWEFRLGLLLAGAFVGLTLSEQFFPRILDSRKIFIVRAVFLLFLALLFSKLLLADYGVTSIATRNFYGVAKVEFTADMTRLMHGSTLHGIEVTDREWINVPSTYYVPASGVGRAISFEQDERKGTGSRVAILGLGAGSISSYCREGDAFIFYEINPEIERIAREHFSYLRRCEGSEVRTGDARILLEEERAAGRPGRYDVLVMDAFSDDTVPAHLVTMQAIQLYKDHLRDEKSIIAVHVSNRYLDLAPVMFRIASALGLNAMVVRDDGSSSPAGLVSSWVLFAEDSSVFTSPIFANANSWMPLVNDAPLWTDDYTSLLPIVDLPEL